MTASTATREPDSLQLLIFELNGVHYALSLTSVREVVRAVLVTPLPDAPDVVEGLIDVRGELIPVYDLRLRFGHAARGLDPAEHIVIAWTGVRRVAFRCDRANRLETVGRSAITSPQPFTDGGRHISGVVQLPDGIVLIQDLQSFLLEPEEESLESALSSAHERD